MSSKEDIDADPARQSHCNEKAQIDHMQELCRRLCILADWLIIAAQSHVVAVLSKRIGHFVNAAWLPGGITDTDGIAAMLNMETRGAVELVNRNQVPAKQPGQSRLFKLADVGDNWTPPGISPGNSSTGVAQPVAQRKRRGKNQGK